MAIFRVSKNRNYTVMSNYHLKDRALTLKSKGLLSMMLSLPEEWDYTTRGLASICKEGVDAIGASLKELEAGGYLVRRQLRDSRGRITDTEYTIYECPHTPQPDTALPHTENPDMDTPDTVSPCTEKPAELNINQENKKQSSTDISNPDPSIPELPSNRQEDGCDAMGYAAARELVLENLEYDILLERYDRERLDEIVDLMVETLCSRKKTIVVAGDEYPAQLVRDKLLKLTPMHIDYAFECMGKNTTYIRNIKKYLLAVLFNAPSTIDHYYAAQVNHDLYGS